ncbi:MAG: uroporphyrinogen decarboxylase family protein [Maribacter sp.]
MNKKAQFDLLLTGEDIPKILFKPILMHFAARFNGSTYGEFAADYKTLVDSNIKCLEHFDLDAVSLISDPYRETAAFGAKIDFIPEGVPRCLNKLVQNVADVNSLTIPDVYTSERTRDRILGAGHYQKILKGSVPLGGWIEGPLAEACTLAGVSEMLVHLMCDPDLVNRIMDKCMIVAKEFTKAQINEGCDYIGIGDAICSQIDVGSYDLFVRDRHLELADYIHSLGAKAKLHICGNIEHLLPSIRALNFDIVDIDYDVNPTKARKILGDKVVIKGNINPVFIQNATVEQLEEKVYSLLQETENEKFILSGGCEISVLTPPENLMKMGEILKKQ